MSVKHPINRTSEETRDKICAMYGEGNPVEAITNECRVSMSNVYTVLRERQTKLQGRKRFQHPAGPLLAPEQMEIINGSLLGDGHIDRPRHGNSLFIKNQKPDRLEYLLWHRNKFLPYKSAIKTTSHKRPIWINGKITEHPTERTSVTFLRTQRSCRFSELLLKWYPYGKKVVPEDIKLTPLTIAIWFCDDGTNASRERRISFSTNGFSWEECEFLTCELKKFGFLSHLKGSGKKEGNKPILVIKSHHYTDFISFVSPYIPWDCFSYKISLDGYKEPKPLFNAKVSPSDVLEIRRLAAEGWFQKDIGKLFSMSRDQISSIVNRRSWANIW